MTILACDAFRMELDSMHRVRFVHDALNDAIIAGRRYFQRARHAFWCNRQRMVTRCDKVIVQAAKDAFAGMTDFGQFAVHRFGRANDPAAINLSDRLMSKAYSEDRISSVRQLDEIKTDAR